MAVDLRLPRDRKYTDRNKYYKGDVSTSEILKSDEKIIGVFYSTDIVPLSVTSIVNGNVKIKQYFITIETPDYIPDLEVDDYVLYAGDGELWVVDSIPKIEDSNDAKAFSKRPPILTHIVLRRGEV